MFIDQEIKQINLAGNNKTKTYNKKWCITDNFLPVT